MLDTVPLTSLTSAYLIDLLLVSVLAIYDWQANATRWGLDDFSDCVRREQTDFKTNSALTPQLADDLIVIICTESSKREKCKRPMPSGQLLSMMIDWCSQTVWQDSVQETGESQPPKFLKL
jgi:hypothetical protein